MHWGSLEEGRRCLQVTTERVCVCVPILPLLLSLPVQNLRSISTARGGERCQHGPDREFHRRGANSFLCSR